MKLAALPMYDLPELHAATHAWWQGLARAFRRQGLEGVPDALDGRMTLDDRSSRSRLLFGQCCGYDLIRSPETLALVATPIYRSRHCRGAYYRSLVVVGEASSAARLEDLRGRRCAINAPCSHSGYTALRHMIAPLVGVSSRGEGRFFSRVEVSGSHTGSLARVREGRADCTSVDCVTFALLARHRAEALQGLRVLAESALAPGLPYVTGSAGGDEQVARLRDGLHLALEDSDLAAARDALLIEGVEDLPPTAYQRIAAMESEADAGAPLLVQS